MCIARIRLDLKVVYQSIFIFYFNEILDLKFIIRKAPWSFDNSLIPSLSFDFTPIWVQIHYLHVDWGIAIIARRVMSHAGVFLMWIIFCLMDL